MFMDSKQILENQKEKQDGPKKGGPYTEKQKLELESIVDKILSITRSNDFRSSSEKQIEVKKPEKKFKTPEDMDRHELPGHNHNPFAAYCYYPDFV